MAGMADDLVAVAETRDRVRDLLAAVAVEHRQIGESAGDAHRRRKAERRALRSQARAQLPRG